MEFDKEFTYEEYVADGVVHGLGVIAALAGALSLILWAGSEAPMGH